MNLSFSQNSRSSSSRNNSPYNRNGAGSPSRLRSGSTPVQRNPGDSSPLQILDDFGRLLLDSERAFHTKLDKDAAERERLHREALEAAAAEHHRVRQAAERIKETLELQADRERRLREEIEVDALERARREKSQHEAAERKRQIDSVKRAEQEQAEKARQEIELEEAKTRLQQQQEREKVEKTRRQAEETERQRKAHEAAAKAAATPSAAPTAPSQVLSNPLVNGVTDQSSPALSTSAKVPHDRQVPVKPALPVAPGSASPLTTSIAERNASHQQYLDLHKRLKKFRENMTKLGKQNQDLKTRMGDGRREIKTRIGQIIGDRTQIQAPLKRLRQILFDAAKYQQPTVDGRQFVVASSPLASSSNQAPMSALLVYLLHMFAKSIVAQFINEASSEVKTADPIGIVAITLFADDEFKCNGTPLIDMLMAKYHFVCPVLWGIYGPENTEGGRKRLGWGRAYAGGPWLDKPMHQSRMQGLGVGFASLALRNFSKSKKINPLPNAEFWRAVAVITNVPPAEITETHLVVLKAMLEGSADRFIALYGQTAVVALRHALVVFPARAEKTFPVAAHALMVVPEVYKRDLKLVL